MPACAAGFLISNAPGRGSNVGAAGSKRTGQAHKGWESTEMVRRYAHLAADHLAPYADRLGALRTAEPRIYGTFTAQS